KTTPPSATERVASSAPPRMPSAKCAKPCTVSLGRHHAEPEDALRDVPVGGQHLVLQRVETCRQLRNVDHQLVRFLAGGDGQGTLGTALPAERDLAER